MQISIQVLFTQLCLMLDDRLDLRASYCDLAIERLRSGIEPVSVIKNVRHDLLAEFVFSLRYLKSP